MPPLRFLAQSLRFPSLVFQVTLPVTDNHKGSAVSQLRYSLMGLLSKWAVNYRGQFLSFFQVPDSLLIIWLDLQPLTHMGKSGPLCAVNRECGQATGGQCFRVRYPGASGCLCTIPIPPYFCSYLCTLYSRPASSLSLSPPSNLFLLEG